MRGPLNISIFDLVLRSLRDIRDQPYLLLDQYGNVLTRISIDLAFQVHTCESDDEIPASYVRVCLDKVHVWGTNERVGRNRMQTRWSHNLQTARHASPGPCVWLSVCLKLSLAFGRVPLIPVTSTWTSSAVADPYRGHRDVFVPRWHLRAAKKRPPILLRSVSTNATRCSTYNFHKTRIYINRIASRQIISIFYGIKRFLKCFTKTGHDTFNWTTW